MQIDLNVNFREALAARNPTTMVDIIRLHGNVTPDDFRDRVIDGKARDRYLIEETGFYIDGVEINRDVEVTIKLTSSVDAEDIAKLMAMSFLIGTNKLVFRCFRPALKTSSEIHMGDMKDYNSAVLDIEYGLMK